MDIGGTLSGRTSRISSGDDDSKDQQTCQASTRLHFSLQTGGPATRDSHDGGRRKRASFYVANAAFFTFLAAMTPRAATQANR